MFRKAKFVEALAELVFNKIFNYFVCLLLDMKSSAEYLFLWPPLRRSAFPGGHPPRNRQSVEGWYNMPDSNLGLVDENLIHCR
jgi:hypothetical protein